MLALSYLRQMRRALEPGLSSVRVDYGALKLRGQPSPRAARSAPPKQLQANHVVSYTD